jgi:hypothetical protein
MVSKYWEGGGIFWSGEECRVKREKKYFLEWGRVEG